MSRWSEQLKDPRWQKLRLERLEASNWTCDRCGTKTETLHCHHVVYKKGSTPWDYKLHDLATLCEKCHEFWHSEVRQERIFSFFKCLDDFQLQEVLDAVQHAVDSWKLTLEEEEIGVIPSRDPGMLLMDAALYCLVYSRKTNEMSDRDIHLVTLPIHQFFRERYIS